MEETTRIEKLATFSHLELKGVFSVYLVQDTIFLISISGIGDAPDKVSLNLSAGTLIVEDLSKNKWLNPEKNKLKLTVHANQLRSVYPHATCYIETINPIIANDFALINGGETKLMEAKLDLNCGNFIYWNSHLCGGKLTLAGQANTLEVYTFSTASVDAINLVANQAYIENNSKGDSKLFVKSKLEYSIHSTGNIYLYGNPPEIILDERTSSGQLIIK